MLLVFQSPTHLDPTAPPVHGRSRAPRHGRKEGSPAPPVVSILYQCYIVELVTMLWLFTEPVKLKFAI